MKKQILDTARKLFNVHGIRPVTARLICNELSISPGSFSYHFPNKDIILETLCSDLLMDYDSCFSELELEEKVTIKDFLDTFKKVFSIQHKYRFFYLSLFECCTQYSKTNNAYKIHQKNNLSLIKRQLSNFSKAETLKNENSSKDIHELSNALLIIINQWLVSAELDSFENKKKKIEHYIQTIAFILTPYLSKKGLRECKSYID